MTELERLYRAEWGRLVAALIRSFGDFDLAEEALQEAFAAAVAEWGGGRMTPRDPRAWLYSTAKHRAIDRRRAQKRHADKLATLVLDDAHDPDEPSDPSDSSHVPDERLRLIFTCCHPALAPEAQVALTLRTLCGLRTEEIARAFLVPTATMAQRLVRATAKIRDARIPYRVPSPDELPARIDTVLQVIYLVFNEGYAALAGDALVRRELCTEAIRLLRLVRNLLPTAPPEVDALLALMLLTDARREARVDAAGELVRLADQDRARWNRHQIAEGLVALECALLAGPPSAYALEAAIAAVHAESPTANATDWPQIAELYRRLWQLHPSAVVALNAAVAISFAHGPEVALPMVESLGEALVDYPLWHATRADLLRRLGRHPEAILAYESARELTQNDAQRRFYTRSIAELQPSSP